MKTFYPISSSFIKNIEEMANAKVLGKEISIDKYKIILIPKDGNYELIMMSKELWTTKYSSNQDSN